MTLSATLLLLLKTITCSFFKEIRLSNPDFLKIIVNTVYNTSKASTVRLIPGSKLALQFS